MENTIENAIDFADEFVGSNVQLGYKPTTKIPEMLVAYAASIRPAADVVVRVPSEKDIEDCIEDFDPYTFESNEVAFYESTKWMTNELRRLNPTLTFTDETN